MKNIVGTGNNSEKNFIKHKPLISEECATLDKLIYTK